MKPKRTSDKIKLYVMLINQLFNEIDKIGNVIDMYVSDNGEHVTTTYRLREIDIKYKLIQILREDVSIKDVHKAIEAMPEMVTFPDGYTTLRHNYRPYGKQGTYEFEHCITKPILPERKIPKFPEFIDVTVLSDAEKHIIITCPNCGEMIHKTDNMCHRCGQRIDWGGVDD